MAEEESHYDYNPSVAAAIVTIIVFSALTIAHAFRLLRTRTWFCIPFVVGGIFESVGYVGRALGNKDPYSLGPYIMQALLILLAPIFFAASVYMSLTRLIRSTGGEALSLLRVSFITKLFVGGDILCFLIQGLGAGILASADSVKQRDTGEAIILASLVLQIVIFGIFILVSSIFHKRLRERPTPKSLASQVDWTRSMYLLYGVSILITLRNLFRVVEYAMGEDGYLLRTEWPIYVLDAIPMAIVLVICLAWYGNTIKVERNVISLDSQDPMA